MELTKVQLQAVTILTVLVLGVLFILPFLSPLLLAAVLAYFSYPLYNRLSKKIHENLAALSICFGLIIILAVIINFGLNFTLNELGSAFFFLANLPTRISLSPTVNELLRSTTTKMIAFISQQATQIPSLIISTFLFFISLFYFLKEGDKIFYTAWRAIPFPDDKKSHLLKDIKNNIDAFLFVTLIVGLLQGVMAGVGFLAFGLNYPYLAGITAAILSIIPVLGPYLLYVGVGLFLFLNQSIPLAISIIIYGLIVGSLLDYAVRPYFMSKKAHIHPLIIFLGIFGGLSVLGILGIIIGPIILSMAVTFIKDLHLYE